MWSVFDDVSGDAIVAFTVQGKDSKSVRVKRTKIPGCAYSGGPDVTTTAVPNEVEIPCSSLLCMSTVGDSASGLSKHLLAVTDSKHNVSLWSASTPAKSTAIHCNQVVSFSSLPGSLVEKHVTQASSWALGNGPVLLGVLCAPAKARNTPSKPPSSSIRPLKLLHCPNHASLDVLVVAWSTTQLQSSETSQPTTKKRRTSSVIQKDTTEAASATPLRDTRRASFIKTQVCTSYRESIPPLVHMESSATATGTCVTLIFPTPVLLDAVRVSGWQWGMTRITFTNNQDPESTSGTWSGMPTDLAATACAISTSHEFVAVGTVNCRVALLDRETWDIISVVESPGICLSLKTLSIVPNAITLVLLYAPDNLIPHEKSHSCLISEMSLTSMKTTNYIIHSVISVISGDIYGNGQQQVVTIHSIDDTAECKATVTDIATLVTSQSDHSEVVNTPFSRLAAELLASSSQTASNLETLSSNIQQEQQLICHAHTVLRTLSSKTELPSPSFLNTVPLFSAPAPNSSSAVTTLVPDGDPFFDQLNELLRGVQQMPPKSSTPSDSASHKILQIQKEISDINHGLATESHTPAPTDVLRQIATTDFLFSTL
ncbi:hypothetical protein Pelo_10888 [Pelomyxa schiedti]|nr:hypothetical protein Pelo_10888 [Pelomyxa schiedti]